MFQVLRLTGNITDDVLLAIAVLIDVLTSLLTTQDKRLVTILG